MGRSDEYSKFKGPLADAIWEFYWWIERFTERDALTPDTHLHQYTSSEGLTGILRNKELWFTDANHLNDSVEVKYGIEVARNIFIMDEGMKPWATRLDEASDLFRCFAACFSADDNSLMQWRLYGDNGRGFRITLHPSSFKSPECAHHYANKVSYGEADVKRRHQEAIDKVLQLSERPDVVAEMARTRGNPEFETEIRQLLFSPLLRNSIFAKHEAYQHENEIRFVVMDDWSKLEESGLVRNRIRGGSLVPFIPIQFEGADAIKEIMVGPAAPDEAISSVERLLKENGWPQIDVTKSRLPYRA